MATKKIPERIEIYCDFCGVLTDKGFGRGSRRRRGGVKIERDSLDFQGCAVADGSTRFDLCDTCLFRVEHALDELKKSIMPEPLPKRCGS